MLCIFYSFPAYFVSGLFYLFLCRFILFHSILIVFFCLFVLQVISLYFCFFLLLTCLISYLFSAYLSYFVAYLSVSTEHPLPGPHLPVEPLPYTPDPVQPRTSFESTCSDKPLHSQHPATHWQSLLSQSIVVIADWCLGTCWDCTPRPSSRSSKCLCRTWNKETSLRFNSSSLCKEKYKYTQ